MDPANDIRNFFKKWPRFYYFIGAVFGPMYMGGLSSKKFLEKYESSGKKLNLGSGPRKLREDVINVDASKYDDVEIVADITNLPFENESAGVVVCDTVLEHVKDTTKALSEIKRILKPGGYAYITLPFLYPFHASPDDFERWTLRGLENSLKDFSIVESGIRSGPFSTATVYLCYIFAMLFSFGSQRLYWLLVNLFMFVFFPIKLLDFIGNRFPHAEDLSSIFYVVVTKK